jgi:hypothetical protein
MESERLEINKNNETRNKQLATQVIVYSVKTRHGLFHAKNIIT